MGSKLALTAVAALLLAGCGSSGSESSSPSTAPSTTIAQAGGGPEIAGTGVDGAALDITDFRGKPLFVNVWSSW